MSEFYQELLQIMDSCDVSANEEMKKHTTFRVGGPAAYYASPRGEEQLSAVLKLCEREQFPYYIVGNGSNLLVGDKGYEGLILSTLKGLHHCVCSGCTLTAGAGVSLSKVAKAALEHSLTGLEFAAGIPGTLGGAVVMNAGAYGREMKDVLRSVRVMDRGGAALTLKADELELGYRKSCISSRGYLVLEAELELTPGERDLIRGEMDRLAGERKKKQPLDFPSAGSTFKRPAGSYAGKLIEEAGLRGFRLGGAQVSEKHCGFIVNGGHASAADILALCQEVKRQVREHSGVELEMEVKVLGKF